MPIPKTTNVLIFFILTFLNYQYFIFAQGIPHSFKHLTETEGLSTNQYCYFINQSKNGFIWISSLDGLNRFDGLNVKTFKPNHLNRTPASERILSQIIEDNSGDLWFSTELFLNQFDTKKDTFLEHRIRDEKGEDILRGYNPFYFEECHNRLWLKADNKIAYLNTNQPSKYDFLPQETKGNWHSVATNKKGEVTQIWSAPWHYGYGVELFKKKAGHWEKTTFIEQLQPKNDTVPPTVLNTLVQNDTIVWLFTQTGLIKLDWRFPLQHKKFTPNSRKTFEFFNGIFTHHDKILISSKNEGLWLFDTTEEQFTDNCVSGYGKNEINSNKPRGLFIDEQQRIWVSHKDKGVDYASNPSLFTSNPLGFKSKYSVEYIFEDYQKNIWISTRNKGLFIVNSMGETLKQYTEEELNNQHIRQLILDDKHRVWGINSNHCYLFDSPYKKEVIQEIKGKEFISIVQLDSKDLLFSTTKGIYRLSKHDSKYIFEVDGAFCKHDSFVFLKLFKDSQGYVYIPFNNSDLWIYEEQKGVLEQKQTLTINAVINNFCEDKKNQIVYIATSRGIFEHNHLNEKNVFAKYKNIVDNIHGILLDKLGKLWYSTSHGLKTHKEKEEWHFREEDGLTSNNFSPNAFLKSSDGRFWFGNNKGINVFHPDSVTPYPHVPNIQIDELLVNSVPYKGDTCIGEAHSIQLDYYQNTLAFKPIAIDFHLPHLCSLHYRLKGYDDSFTKIKNGEQARFTKIPPGEYQFEVFGTNANGKKSETKQVNIQIMPPYWKTYWFWGLLIAVSSFIIYRLFRAYVDKKLHKKQLIIEKQKAQSDERERIAAELHDNMGSGLSSISFLSRSLMKTEKNAETKTLIENIHHLSNELIEGMDESIRALDTEYDSLENLVYDIRQYTSKYLSINNLEFDIEIPEDFPEIDLRGEQRRNLFLVTKEALHNIVKHAQASKVILLITIPENTLLIHVSDNGKGFEIDTADKKRKGLTNMQKRAKSIGASFDISSIPNTGTTLVFSFPFA